MDDERAVEPADEARGAPLLDERADGAGVLGVETIDLQPTRRAR